MKDLSLSKRMETYRESAPGIGARRGAVNWTAFGAATGSALAMASSASASIIYTHPANPVTAEIPGLPPNHPGPLNSRNSAAFSVGPGHFRIFVSQSASSSSFPGGTRGQAGLLGLGGAAPAEELFAAGATHLVPVSAAGDNGWIRIEVFNGPNGLADEIEAIDWAYNSVAGGPITPGQESGGGGGGSSTPEPSTAAMALLAAGSAGVLAWRRRRVAGA